MPRWLVPNTEVTLKNVSQLVMVRIKKQGKTIVNADEAHMISGAGAGGQNKSTDLANMLNALGKGDIKVIASQLGKNIESILKKTEH